jgi:hypothetical protein
MLVSVYRIVYLTLILVCSVGLSACSTQTTKSVAQVKNPQVKKIVVVMVMDPPRFVVENKGGPLMLLAIPGYIIKKSMDSNKSDVLTLGLQSAELKMGREMSSALRAELARKGYDVSITTDVKRAYDDPESISYESIKTDADAILSARFSEAGLYSARFSTNYIPRLNLDVEMLAAKGKAELYSQKISYGADASKATDDQIPCDPKYAYGSFDLAMENQPEVAESFRAGIRAIATRVAQQVRQNGI